MIVGHGPSVLTGLGAVIDSHVVVRLKYALLRSHDPFHWGTRTDYLCARSPRFDHGLYPFWLYQNEMADYYRKFSDKKPTTGLCAVFCALERGFTDIALIGFDRLLHPEQPDPPHTWVGHDKFAERDCLKSLGITWRNSLNTSPTEG